MLIGFILCISLSIFITSSIITVSGLSGYLHENILTGAVIGTEEMTSYSTIVSIASLFVIFLCVFIMIKKHQR
jgi:hypothetical protein